MALSQVNYPHATSAQIETDALSLDALLCSAWWGFLRRRLNAGVKDYRRTSVLTHGPLRPTDGETTDVSASFEVQPNNLFNKAFVKLIGKKLLGSPRETLQNDLSDLANAEEGS